MRYDFKTVVDRGAQASEKWAAMKSAAPDVGRDIVPFSIADMELKTAPEIIDGLVKYLKDDAILGYTVANDAYIRAVVDWMERRHAWDIDGSHICVSNGIIPALYDAVKAFSDPDDGVVLLTPVYYPFSSAIMRNGRRVVECPLVTDGSIYRIDFEALDTATRPDSVKLLMFCSPHNPVGRVWSRGELERVAEICLRNGVTILSDEIHMDLLMFDNVHTPMASISDEVAASTITCTSPSKTFNLAGMQASNIIISNGALRDKFRAEQGRSGFDCMGALAYRACEIAYDRAERWLDELLVHIEENYRELVRIMRARLPEAVVYPLEGTYLAWLDMRGFGYSHFDLETLMTKQAHVFMDEGYIFGAQGAGFERMNIACPRRVLTDALERMERALRDPHLE